MGKAPKTIIALAANAIFAGFFALAFSFLNLMWLECAIKHYPKVSYPTYRSVSRIGYNLRPKKGPHQGPVKLDHEQIFLHAFA